MHIYVLPNLLTTGNLFFGFFGIIKSIQGDFHLAAYAVVAGAIFDLLDGRMARLTRSTSQFGAEYDSLCDLVSFCVSPAILLYQWSLNGFGRIGWLAAFLFVACGALRLARFNVQANVIEKSYFQGLPTPMAAGIVASSVLAFQDQEIEAHANLGLLVMTFLLAFVMVSNFRYRSFKDVDFKQRLPFWYLIAGVVLLIVVAARPELMLFTLFLGYAILGAVFGILRLGKNARAMAPNAYNPKDRNREQDLVEDEDGEETEDEDDVENNKQ